MSAEKHPPKGDGLLPRDLAASWTKIGYGLGVVGVIAFLAGMFGADQARFGAAYLVGFMFTTTIALGALFFVVIQHLARAGWSVGPRRIMEWLSQGLVASAVLFVPLVILAPKVWHHWMGEHAKHDSILIKKTAYLNDTFFYIRAIVFLLTWALLAIWFYKTSREQDTSGDRTLSEKLQMAAAPSVAALGLTTTFAGFDWVMSLDPHWYSTIFGVYIFAGCLLSSHAMLSLIIVRFRRDNIGGSLLTVEHQHDVGKYLFAWVIFWAYIGFAQFMLIFYANIPEETVWFRHRWEHGWYVVSLMLFLGHFVAPFLMLISRTAKRDPKLLALSAALLLFVHWVDLYWLVMPNFDEHFHFQWVDIAGLLAPVGVTAAWLAKRVLADPAYPLKDPYIPEAIKAENL
ncbi:MAG: hypothetical protein HOW73_37080 [Polyangiaceae bacterium]|nr:hypothetical protein [Polyangiaceae bacterium]